MALALGVLAATVAASPGDTIATAAATLPNGAAPVQVPEVTTGDGEGARPPGTGGTDAGGPTTTVTTGDGEGGGDPPGPGVELIDQTTWVPVDGTFAVTLRPRDLPPGATASLHVHEALSSRNDFTDSLAEGPGGARLGTPVSGRSLDPGDGATPGTPGGGGVTLAFDPSAIGLADPGDYGVYPIEVAVHDPSGQQVAGLVTYLLRLPPESWFPSGQLSLAVILELGAPPALRPDGTAELSTTEVGAARDRVDALEATDVPVTLAPVPETLDALRAVRPRLLADLRDALPGSQVLARPYVDMDLHAWADANLVTEAPPEAEAGARVVRDRLGLEPTPNIWLTGDTVSPVESSTWSRLGVRHAILPGSALAEDPDPTQSISPRLQLPGGVSGFVSDGGLADRLVSVDSRLAAHNLVAELAMIWAERPAEPRPVVLRLPDAPRVDTELIAYTLNLLDDRGSAAPVAPVTTSRLIDAHGSGEVAEAPLAPKAATEDLSWMTDEVDRASRTASGLAGTFTDAALVASLRRSLLVAPGTGVEPADRRDHLSRVERAATAVAEQVRAPDTFRITLTARDGTVPLTLTNDLDQPVDVQVRLRSNQLEFPDGAVFDLTIPPEGVRVDLEVRTRTSGAFPLDITLTSPDGNVVLDETTFNIRSTAISGVGLVLSAGAALVLVVWWARHWRRARRRDGAAGEPPDAHDISSGSGTN